MNNKWNHGKNSEKITKNSTWVFFIAEKNTHNNFVNNITSGFPLGLVKLENLEKWEGIFQSGKSQGILNRLEKSGKSQGKPHKILEK